MDETSPGPPPEPPDAPPAEPPDDVPAAARAGAPAPASARDLGPGPGPGAGPASPSAGVPARLTVVTLGARDLPKLRAFYLALGWPELPSSDDTWAAFPLGGALLALYPLEDLTREAAPSAGPPPAGWNGTTLACNVESEAQVDTAYAAALAAGAASVEPPTDREWGGRSAYVADPEGNRWELAWARHAVFDARGAVTSLG